MRQAPGLADLQTVHFVRESVPAAYQGVLSPVEPHHHGDVIKWKYFPHYWPFVREIHRPPVNFPHKGQWRGALMFTLICARMNGWVNNGEAGDLRRYLAHYDVIVMKRDITKHIISCHFVVRCCWPCAGWWLGSVGSMPIVTLRVLFVLTRPVRRTLMSSSANNSEYCKEVVA